MHLVGEIQGQRFENTGWFLADEAARTLRWGAQAERTYSGRLQVIEDGGGSRLLVHPEFGPGSPDDEVQHRTAGDSGAVGVLRRVGLLRLEGVGLTEAHADAGVGRDRRSAVGALLRR